MFCNLIFISGANVLLKHIIQRPRPDGYRLISESGYSFPSGHSMVSMAFYGFFFYFSVFHQSSLAFGPKKIKIFLEKNTFFCAKIIFFGRKAREDR